MNNNIHKFQNLDSEIIQILKEIKKAGGTGLLVGGYVRDQFFGHESKDIDIEVFGISQYILNNLLSNFGKVDNVGNSFGVTKLTTKKNDYDFNLPRIEVKSGEGHKGFTIEVNPYMSTYEAGLRRDITINSIYYNPLTGELIDHFGGINDIENRLLKHVSPQFADDPLRVLRLVQFAGRKNMSVDIETIELSKTLLDEFCTISKERFWIEFEKLLVKGVNIAKGLEVLYSTNWVSKFPQLNGVLDTKEKVAKIGQQCNSILDSQNNLVLRLAILCFDMAAPIEFLNAIDAPNKVKSSVIELIKLTKTIIRNFDSSFEIKKIISTKKHTNKGMLLELIFCLYNETELYTKINSIFATFSESDLIPIIKGEDLTSRGWTTSKELGHKLKEIFEYQLKTGSSKEQLIKKFL